MSRTIFKKVSTYTRMGCDILALDFTPRISYNSFIFIYKNLNIHKKVNLQLAVQKRNCKLQTEFKNF